MPRLPRLMLAGLVACSLLLSACGADNQSAGKLEASTAQELLAELNQIEENALAGNCVVANGHAITLAGGFQLLPDTVDPDLKRVLINSAERLSSLLSEECSSSPEPTEPPPTEPPPSETETQTDTNTETQPDTETETNTETGPPSGGVGP